MFQLSLTPLLLLRQRTASTRTQAWISLSLLAVSRPFDETLVRIGKKKNAKKKAPKQKVYRIAKRALFIHKNIPLSIHFISRVTERSLNLRTREL